MIPREFYARNTVLVARELIGAILIRSIDGRVIRSRIVETEAYREDDPASHSFRGPTDRCRVMFGPPGVAYVYRSYGIHHCLNVVTEPEGTGCAVLIRAVEPMEAFEYLWSRRFPQTRYDANRIREISNGPGKLTEALGITVGEFNGVDLDSPPLEITRSPDPDLQLVESDVRIGISRGRDARWRFYDSASEYVSRKPGR